MAGFDYDLFVIGAGSGGVRASRIAAGHGARVGICEDDLVGGTCVIRGCVPKKLLVYGSHVSEDIEDAAAYGWTIAHPSFNWATLRDNVQKEVMRLNGVYKNLLKGAKVDLVVGRGRLMDAHTIAVGERTVTADKILLATGARPWRPDIEGADLAIVSDDAFHLQELPKRVVIVGGGYIAVEFAGIFNGLGADVTMVVRRERVLRGFDEECRQAVQDGMIAKGVAFRTGAQITRLQRGGNAITATFADGTSIDADVVMYATGRHPNTAGLGLEKVGVHLDKAGAVAVDEWSRTTVDNIYAVGDVTNRLNLTPVAILEGHCFADTVFGNRPRKPDHRDVPSAVFSQPQLATVGLGEEQARQVYGDVHVYDARFRPMKYTLSGREQRTFMKLVVDAASDRVVGVHMVGDDAAELIQGIAIAVKAGATKAIFDATVGIHPTAGEEFVTMRTRRPDPAPTAKAAE
ncbi:glutathione-disulfide reductase [Reyranella sp. CPCC 100927]|uniref:glutathione-disulfide reductase n=1 Tax=Reyranella sp. CPCC 100927 TaxID=2599616 RepID=UPI0011B787FA|nr:glutathione-disulfide reductase [Reyranella sp. CPCC 100927]TWT13787.1 glutathione-disulfide reductase [Reyranella sp. CPCC 100927]